MNDILIGAISMASFIVGLFFFRFWRTTADRFFLFFAVSFWLESANRLLLAATSGLREDSPFYYMIRLLAYMLIVIAIIDKNRSKKRGPPTI